MLDSFPPPCPQFRFVWEFWLPCGYFEAYGEDGSESHMQVFAIPFPALHMPASFPVVSVLLLPSRETWEGPLNTQEILKKNMTLALLPVVI